MLAHALAKSALFREPTIVEIAAKKNKTPSQVVLLTHGSFAISDDVRQAFEDESGLELEVLQAGDAGEVVTRALLTAGNLSLTQGVISLLGEWLNNENPEQDLFAVTSMFGAARVVGSALREIHKIEGETKAVIELSSLQPFTDILQHQGLVLWRELVVLAEVDFGQFHGRLPEEVLGGISGDQAERQPTDELGPLDQAVGRGDRPPGRWSAPRPPPRRRRRGSGRAGPERSSSCARRPGGARRGRQHRDQSAERRQRFCGIGANILY